MKIDHGLLTHCKNIAYQVAPELRRNPLYVYSAELFDGLDLPPGCHGVCFNPRLTHYAYAERIGSAWKGPGPLIVLFGPSIAADCRPELFRDCVLNVLLHELGHALPAPEDLPTDDLADVLDCKEVRELQARKRQEADALPTPDPGSDTDWHGKDYVRITTHLWARASLSGWDIPAHWLYGPAWYLSQPAHWVVALLREIIELRDATFTEILAEDPPAQFQAMWDGAVDCFLSHRSSKK